MDAPPIYPPVQQGQPSQQPLYNVQPMPPNGQYAFPANTNSTVSINATLKSFEPPGKCCFCVPPKIGAMTVAIISAIFHVASIFFIFSGTLNTFVNLLMTIFCLLGAYWIYTGSYNLLAIYAATYTVFTVINIAMTIFILAISTCLGIKECEDHKRNWMIATGVASILRLYFVYVTLDYAIKLRKEATKRQNAKPGGF